MRVFHLEKHPFSKVQNSLMEHLLSNSVHLFILSIFDEHAQDRFVQLRKQTGKPLKRTEKSCI